MKNSDVNTKNTFLAFSNDLDSFFGSRDFRIGDYKIDELILKYYDEQSKKHTEEFSIEPWILRKFLIFISPKIDDPSRIIQKFFNVINKHYGEDYMMYSPMFVRNKSVYSSLLIMSLTIEELEYLLLKKRDYQLIPKKNLQFIAPPKDIESKIQSLFGDEVLSLGSNDSLLSIMKTNDKNRDLYFDVFNEFESIIFNFLADNKLDKLDFHENLYKYMMWDYEDDCPYIPTTFFLSLPYAILYETILTGIDPMGKLVVSETIVRN